MREEFRPNRVSRSDLRYNTACRFAKALEMDFMPGLTERRSRSKVAVDSGRVLVAFAIACLATLTCRAALVPSWLPEDQRFEVEGTSNEIVQVDHTLALMRDAIHPKLRERMQEGDLGPTLEWIIHVSLPSATNETAYFETYRKPLAAIDFSDHVLLTNRASRLSYLPPMVKLSLVFDEIRKDSVSRAIPGVDYPGVSYEDEGSTPSTLRLVLHAPKTPRLFRVRTQSGSRFSRNVEFQWVPLKGNTGFPRGVRRSADGSAIEDFGIHYGVARQHAEVAVFSRETGKSWGVPARIVTSVDPLSTHHYVDGKISYVDYGDFRDWYDLDGQNRIIGFRRRMPGMVGGQRYSNQGELIVESYSDDRPKTTRKVKYSVMDGKLTYEVLDGEIHYKNEHTRFRKY